MRCFTILAIVLAVSADCLAQNVDVAKATRKSDGSQAKLCELILQKMELVQRSEDKKTLIPLDNIISLLEIIKKSPLKESGQPNENSGANKDLGKNNDSLDGSGRRSRGRGHRRPKISHGTVHHVIDTIPDIIRASQTPPEYDDRDEYRRYSESRYYQPTERRLDVNPPPINPPPLFPRPRIESDSVQVKEEPKKIVSESETKENSVKETIVSSNRSEDSTDNEKILRSLKPGSNDTLDALKNLIGNSDNVKLRTLIKTLIANQKAAAAAEKKERTKPSEGASPVKKVDSLRRAIPKDSARNELAPAALGDKKSPPRRTKLMTTKGKPMPDVASSRLGLNDEWNWDSDTMPVYPQVPRRLHTKIIHEDEKINQNVNTNTDRDISKMPRFSSRRSYGNRPHRHYDQHYVDKNKSVNANSNSNVNQMEIQSNGLSTDRFTSVRRSLDSFVDENQNTNANTNVNTNSNINRHIVPRNKRRGREPRRFV